MSTRDQLVETPPEAVAAARTAVPRASLPGAGGEALPARGMPDGAAPAQHPAFPRGAALDAAAAQSWETAYREHVVPVYRFVASRTGNRPDAEDVTAQVFLRALPRLRQGASTGEVRAYLLQTARTSLAEHWAARYGAAVEPLDEDRDRPATTAETAPPQGSTAPSRGERRVAAVLALLPENYRRVLELRFLSGMSVRETAEGLGISVANAKVLQWRALRRAAQLGAEVST